MAVEKRSDVNPKEGVHKYGADADFADKVNKKYPTDTKEHALAAWHYINMPKNAAKYDSGSLATIKGHIRNKLKGYGVHLGK